MYLVFYLPHFESVVKKNLFLVGKKYWRGIYPLSTPRVTSVCVYVCACVHLHARVRICCVCKSIIILCHHENNHDIVPVRAQVASETENKLYCSHKF